MDHSGTFNTWVGNIASVAAILGTFVGWVPAIAAGVALCWYLIQIYESQTLQRWLASRRARKIAHLRAKIVELEARTVLEARMLQAPDDPD